MAIYGFIRCPGLNGEELPVSQIAEMQRAAEVRDGELAGVFIDRNSPGGKAAIVGRPAAKEILETLQAGDTLIVRTLDRLRYSAHDVEKTLGTLAAREVHVYAIQPALGGVNFDPALCKAILPVFALPRRIEKTLRSERFTELARQRKEQGLAYGGAPTAKKIVERGGVKHLEWDFDELAIIAEIARRLPKEGAAAVAKDLWRHVLFTESRRAPYFASCIAHIKHRE
ncbi:MAG: recombinase family protein [Thermoguttaceae bacterium]